MPPTEQYDPTRRRANSTTTPDEQLVEIPVEPPRNPELYEPTDHFLQRHHSALTVFKRDADPISGGSEE